MCLGMIATYDHRTFCLIVQADNCLLTLVMYFVTAGNLFQPLITDILPYTFEVNVFSDHTNPFFESKVFIWWKKFRYLITGKYSCLVYNTLCNLTYVSPLQATEYALDPSTKIIPARVCYIKLFHTQVPPYVFEKTSMNSKKWSHHFLKKPEGK